MEKQRIIIGVLIGIGAVSLALISLTLSSTWLWWEMMPKGSEVAFSIESGAANSMLNSLSEIKNTIGPISSIEPFITTSKKIAFAKKGSTQTLIVVGKWGDMAKNQSSLIQEGWQFSKKANVFFAYKSKDTSVLVAKGKMSSMAAASIRMWAVIFHGKQPIQPIAIAAIQKNQFPGLEKSLGLVAHHYKKGILAVIDAAEADRAPLNPKQANETKDMVNLFSDTRDILALPKELLLLIPPSEKKILYSKVVEQVGLGKVLKQVLAEMDSLNSVLIFRGRQTAVIGTNKDGNAFIKAIKPHIETQDGYNYPQRRAFKLPDGTLGYEYRPAVANKSWIHTSPECEYFEGKQQTWWACASNSKGAIGNSESDTLSAVKNSTDWSWYLKIAQIKQIQSDKDITAAMVGNNSRALLYIK